VKPQEHLRAVSLFRSQALVIGRRPLGESDRLVEFYTRSYGKVRGVARSARRMRSRFGSALEPFTLGELVFFDTGRSDLVQVDHFDIVHPFVTVREDLERLGRGAWMAECLSRLSADRDPHPALFALAVRSLRALESPGIAPARVTISVAVRAVHLLGHRPRLDRCVACGRAHPLPAPVIDMTAGGLVCAACRPAPDALAVSASALGALGRLHGLGWDEGLRLPFGAPLTRELLALLEGVVARLMGRVPQSARFIAQTRRGLSGLAVPVPPTGARPAARDRFPGSGQ
jgi:DNA repair protein RecO (recombination protein O)